MKEVTRTIYQADDGKIFEAKAECEKYEADIRDREKRTSYWRVNHTPDLTEGRGFYCCDLLEVYGPEHDADELVQDFCFRSYGRKVQFVQGVAAHPGWTVHRIDRANFLREHTASVGSTVAPAARIRLVVGPGEKGLVKAAPASS